jgi:hypothetical protein
MTSKGAELRDDTGATIVTTKHAQALTEENK